MLEGVAVTGRAVDASAQRLIHQLITKLQLSWIRAIDIMLQQLRAAVPVALPTSRQQLFLNGPAAKALQQTTQLLRQLQA